MYASGSFAVAGGDNWATILDTLLDAIVGAASSPWSNVTTSAPTPVQLRGFAPTTYTAPDSSPSPTEYRTIYLNTDPDENTMIRFYADTDSIKTAICDLTTYPSGTWSTTATSDWKHWVHDNSAASTVRETTVHGNWSSGNLDATYAGTIFWWIQDEALCVTHWLNTGSIGGGFFVWVKYLNGSTLPNGMTTRGPGSPGLYPAISCDQALWSIANYLPNDGMSILHPANDGFWNAQHLLIQSAALVESGENAVSDVVFVHPADRFTVTHACPYIRVTTGGVATAVGDTRTINGQGYDCFHKATLAWWIANTDIVE